MTQSWVFFAMTVILMQSPVRSCWKIFALNSLQEVVVGSRKTSWLFCQRALFCFNWNNPSWLMAYLCPDCCQLLENTWDWFLYWLICTALESFGGQRLLQRADINVGTNVTSFFRIRARTTGKVGGKDLRQLTCFGEWWKSFCFL